jgi:hypothetical protein
MSRHPGPRPVADRHWPATDEGGGDMACPSAVPGLGAPGLHEPARGQAPMKPPARAGGSAGLFAGTRPDPMGGLFQVMAHGNS